VQEQSQKSEMGAALRGDFERLRARRQGGGETSPEPVAPYATAPPDELAAEQARPAAGEAPVETPAGTERQSWFGRLRNRR